MIMRVPKNLVQPKTGETHILFGTRSLKYHKFQDPDWCAIDKIAQYDALIRLHEKDLDLRKVKAIVERRIMLEKLKTFLDEVKINRQKLKLALYGNPQEVKNLLQNHIELQILYANMPSATVKEHMDQRTFSKRKELDNLKCKETKLGLIYKDRLLDLAKTQDRIKYFDSKELPDKMLTKKLRMELKNSETRMRAINVVNHAYFTIIHTLMQDGIYFGPTLQALHEDLIEQRDFIYRTIRMGIPALESLNVLSETCMKLETKTRREIQIHISDILSHREKINKNNEIIKKFVRNDSDFKIYPTRYNRETYSMTLLKNQLENIERIMKDVKKATGCYHAEYIYARLKKQTLNNKQLEDKIVYKEREKRSLEKREDYAVVRKDMLQFNLTDEDIKRHRDIEKYNEDIQQQKTAQKQHEKDLKASGEIVCLLRQAFQHFTEVLCNVGESHTTYKMPYPNSALNLPLLKFSEAAAKIKPPSPLEQDIETLLKVTKMKVKVLMEKYNTMPPLSIDGQTKAEIMFHNDTIDDIAPEGLDADETHQQSLIIFSAFQDANVPNRQFIKNMSQKIVEINAHKED